VQWLFSRVTLIRGWFFERRVHDLRLAEAAGTDHQQRVAVAVRHVAGADAEIVLLALQLADGGEVRLRSLSALRRTNRLSDSWTSGLLDWGRDLYRVGLGTSGLLHLSTHVRDGRVGPRGTLRHLDRGGAISDVVSLSVHCYLLPVTSPELPTMTVSYRSRM